MFAAEQIANWQGVIATAIAVGVPGLVTILAAAKQQNKKLDAVGKAVATSNGRTTGQLVEALAHRFDELSAGQDHMRHQLADHTVQDASNFAALEAQLRQANAAAANVRALELHVVDLGHRVDEMKEQTS